jgi:hypothetical protein
MSKLLTGVFLYQEKMFRIDLDFLEPLADLDLALFLGAAFFAEPFLAEAFLEEALVLDLAEAFFFGAAFFAFFFAAGLDFFAAFFATFTFLRALGLAAATASVLPFDLAAVLRDFFLLFFAAAIGKSSKNLRISILTNKACIKN